jgi:hypothetical protein
MALTQCANRMIAGAPVSVLDYGAALDGTTDDTAAWTAALATGRSVAFPAGQSLVTDQLAFSGTDGQSIVGAGRYKSRLLVSYASFDMSAGSVVELNGWHQRVEQLGLVFTQPSTAVRANIKQYPVAIDVNGQGRPHLSGLLIQAGWRGILMQGNCGGAVLDDLQVGCFEAGAVIDGALDSVRINRFHFWPFDFAGDAPLYSVYSDGTTIALDIGRVDDLNMSSILCFRGRLVFADHGGGSAFGVGSDITLDSNYGRLEFNAGEMAISNLYSSTGATNDFLVRQTGGELKISGLAIEAGQNLSNPLVQVTGGTMIASSVFATAYAPATRVFQLTGGRLNLSNGFIQVGAENRTVPMIDVTGGRAVVTGMSASDYGGFTGEFIKVHADGHHVVSGNSALGWSVTTPTTKVFGLYGPNGGVATGLSGGDVTAPAYRRKYTGTLDGSGDATVAHGLTDGHARMVSVDAFYVGGSGERIPFSPAYVDGTNVDLAAGAPGADADYVVWLTYV